MSKTALWDRLGKTDPSQTKPFQRAGGFKGTAIKPMFSFRRMTEEFGPCGEGWGVNEPLFQVVPGCDGESLVFCTVSVWHGKPEQFVFGVGGDKIINKFSSGMKSDDEAFKKAFTDAITNALKLIGVGADVHMGMFDDNKYVAELKKEIAEEKPSPMLINDFMVDYREAIMEYTDGTQLLEWWNSDEQKEIRRKNDLNQIQVDSLKKLVMDRRVHLAKVKAA